MPLASFRGTHTLRHVRYQSRDLRAPSPRGALGSMTVEASAPGAWFTGVLPYFCRTFAVISMVFHCRPSVPFPASGARPIQPASHAGVKFRAAAACVLTAFCCEVHTSSLAQSDLSPFEVSLRPRGAAQTHPRLFPGLLSVTTVGAAVEHSGPLLFVGPLSGV